MKIALISPTLGSSNLRVVPFSQRATAVQRVEKYLRRQGHLIARFEMRENEFFPSFEFTEFAKIHDVEFTLGFGGEITAHQLLSHSGIWSIFISPEDLAQLSKCSSHLLSAMQKASAIVVDDLRVRDELFHRFPFAKKHIHYIRKAISCLPREMGNTPRSLGLPNEASWFVLICRESSREWIERIIERFDRWHRENPSIYLLTIGRVAGDHWSKEIARHFNQPGIVAQVNLSPARFSYTIRNAFAVIDASDYPAESLYTLHAMQQGAIVAIRSECAGDYLDAQNSIPFTDSEDLDATCRTLACDAHRSNLRNTLGKAVQETAREYYGIERESDEYRRLLKKVLEKPRFTKPWDEKSKAI